jgi:hypothetical protein
MNVGPKYHVVYFVIISNILAVDISEVEATLASLR